MNLIDLIPGGRMVQMAVLASIAAALIGAVTWGVHSYNEGLRQDGRDETQHKWDADNRRRDAEANAEREKNAKEGFRRIEQQAATEQRKIDEIASLNTRVAGLVGELRNRPERPAPGSSTASNPTSPTACTGAELYRPDAEFLIREAARAQRILIERDACHDKYDTLRATK